MPNWIDEQVQKQRFEDMVRTAERDRLAELMPAGRLQSVPFYSPILARLGRQLEIYGYRLQARYGSTPEVAIAAESGGTSSHC